MALTLINSPGLSTSNAYSSLATANLFIEENIHIYTTFASLSTNNANACIIYATTLLDTQMKWFGYKTYSNQSLDWPRDGVYDKNNDIIISTDIPIDIQRGCAFYSYFLSQSDRTADSDTAGFKKLKAGSLFMEVDKYDRRPTMPSIVWDILKPYGNKMNQLPRVLERI